MSKTNESLMQRRVAAVPRGVGQIHPIFADHAKNSSVVDVEGREFIDFAGGIAVLNTGHLHPKIVKAVEDQLHKLTHTCFQVLAYEPYVELCEKINARVPGDFAKKTLLVTTGSEAVENAVKIARAATGRAGVIAFTGAYHGRTMMTLGLTGKVAPYSAGMGLMPGGIFRAQYPCAIHGVSVDESIASIERIFKNDAEPRDIAVAGAYGFVAASEAGVMVVGGMGTEAPYEVTTLPLTSTTRLASSAEMSGAMRAILPSSMATSLMPWSFWDGSTTVPPFTIRSYMAK